MRAPRALIRTSEWSRGFLFDPRNLCVQTYGDLLAWTQTQLLDRGDEPVILSTQAALYHMALEPDHIPDWQDLVFQAKALGYPVLEVSSLISLFISLPRLFVV